MKPRTYRVKDEMSELTFTVRKDMYRQYTLEDDENVIWLRLPDEARTGLIKLLGKMSQNAYLERGLTQEEAGRLSDLYHALY